MGDYGTAAGRESSGRGAMNSNRRPTLPALAWQVADVLAAGAEELRMAKDPVPVADRLLVAAMAACRDLRAARETEKRRQGDVL